MFFILFCISIISIVSLISNHAWNKNMDVCVLENIVTDFFDKRESLLNSISVSAYTALGVKRVGNTNHVRIDASVSNSEDNIKSFSEQASDIRRFRSLSKPESSRIDVCSTIMIGSEEFKTIIINLMKKLYINEPFFKIVYDKRPTLCSEIIDKMGESLRKILCWNEEDSSVCDILSPDSLWLFSVDLGDKELNYVYQKMLKCPDDNVTGEKKNLLKYLSINRWHPRSVRNPKINISFANRYLLSAIFGEKVADLVIKKQNEIFTSYIVDSLEKESHSGMFVMLRPKTLKDIVNKSCNEANVDFAKFEHLLDFGRFFPPRNEWLIDNGGNCRIIKKPYFV